MAVAGRKPKPTHLKLLAGNPGHRPLTPNEPEPEGDLTDPPEWLSESQKDAWRYAIENAPAGMLKKLDQSVLVTWVVASDYHRDATERVNKRGLVVLSRVQREPVQNPYLAVVNRQAQIMQKAAAELGFTPSSRTRISLPGGDGGGSKFDRYK